MGINALGASAGCKSDVAFHRFCRETRSNDTGTRTPNSLLFEHHVLCKSKATLVVKTRIFKKHVSGWILKKKKTPGNFGVGHFETVKAR